jgi:Flp pilus assembly protein TadG
MMRFITHLRSDERGNSFVEMGLVLPLLTAVLVGSVDISRAVSARLKLEQAAQRTIELVQASTYKTSQNSTLQSDAQTAAGAGSTATVTSWMECDYNGTHLDYDTGTCNTGQSYQRYVKVSISQKFTPMFGTKYFPGANSDGTYTLTGVAGLRTQ